MVLRLFSIDRMLVTLAGQMYASLVAVRINLLMILLLFKNTRLEDCRNLILLCGTKFEKMEARESNALWRRWGKLKENGFVAAAAAVVVINKEKQN